MNAHLYTIKNEIYIRINDHTLMKKPNKKHAIIANQPIIHVTTNQC